MFGSTWTVRAGDTDYSGRIYTPVVVDFVIKTIQDFRAHLGFTNNRFQAETYLPPAVNVDINYRAAIRVDDRLRISLDPSIGSSSVTYAVTGSVEGTPVFEGTVTTAFVDKETQEAIPVPDEFRTAVTDFETGSG
jgi:acyl-CoA thioesterase FadM